jgi:hypothetical protein
VPRCDALRVKVFRAEKTHENRCLLTAESEEGFWNERVGWESVISVEHDGIAWLAVDMANRDYKHETQT